MNIHHKPVLLKESIDFLVTDESGIYFDGTLGFGGHSQEILKKLNRDALLVATDIDKDAFNFSKKKFCEEKRMKIYNFNFSQIGVISKIESLQKFTGIFADLGVSSFQLDSPSSGFTYRDSAELDLRMDKNKTVKAADIVNSYSEEDIAGILYEFGEEKKSRQIAHRIVERRKVSQIKNTLQLKEIISEIVPERYLTKTLSRVFQALRIYINDELNVLKSFLNDSTSLLKKGGRLVVISYHSLEDRIVKEHFKYETLDCICPKDFPVCKCDKEQRLKILTKKPVVPTKKEIMLNSRARSAKLRVAERV